MRSLRSAGHGPLRGHLCTQLGRAGMCPPPAAGLPAYTRPSTEGKEGRRQGGTDSAVAVRAVRCSPGHAGQHGQPTAVPDPPHNRQDVQAGLPAGRGSPGPPVVAARAAAWGCAAPQAPLLRRCRSQGKSRAAFGPRACPQYLPAAAPGTAAGGKRRSSMHGYACAHPVASAGLSELLLEAECSEYHPPPPPPTAEHAEAEWPELAKGTGLGGGAGAEHETRGSTGRALSFWAPLSRGSGPRHVSTPEGTGPGSLLREALAQASGDDGAEPCQALLGTSPAPRSLAIPSCSLLQVSTSQGS